METFTKYMSALPVMPDIAAKIISIPEDNIDISFKELENMIKVDPGLATKILKVANSAMYARQKEVTSLQAAITLLGFKTIKSLVFLVSASNMFKKDNSREFFKSFWKHSILTAFLSQNIAVRTGFKRLSDEIFLAGLLHDIGKVPLYQADPELFYRITDTNSEKMIYNADHKEIGGAVLNSWSFPEVYVDTAMEHGTYNITSPHKTLILIVSAADIISGFYEDFSRSEHPAEALKAFMLRLNMKDEDLQYYRDDFYSSLASDKLFIECGSLFGIEK